MFATFGRIRILHTYIDKYTLLPGNKVSVIKFGKFGEKQAIPSFKSKKMKAVEFLNILKATTNKKSNEGRQTEITGF